MAINGNKFIVKLNGTPIAGAKSDDIEVRCDTIEVASPSQGQWREFLAGRKDWTINTSYLVLASSDLQNVLAVGTTFTVSFMDRQWLNALVGNAILIACKIQATRGNLITGVFQFQGTGELTHVYP